MIWRKKFGIFTVQLDLTGFGLALMTNPGRGMVIVVIGPLMVMT